MWEVVVNVLTVFLNIPSSISAKQYVTSRGVWLAYANFFNVLNIYSSWLVIEEKLELQYVQYILFSYVLWKNNNQQQVIQ